MADQTRFNSVLLERFAPQLAKDTTTLKQGADNNIIIPLIADFNPDLPLTPDDVTPVTGPQADAGLSWLSQVLSDPGTGRDHVTGDGIINIVPDVVDALTLIDDLDEEAVIYGWALMDEAKTKILATKKLETPKRAQFIGDIVSLDGFQLRIPKSAF